MYKCGDKCKGLQELLRGMSVAPGNRSAPHMEQINVSHQRISTTAKSIRFVNLYLVTVSPWSSCCCFSTSYVAALTPGAKTVHHVTREHSLLFIILTHFRDLSKESQSVTQM